MRGFPYTLTFIFMWALKGIMPIMANSIFAYDTRVFVVGAWAFGFLLVLVL